MELLKNLALSISGGLVVGSILMANIGLKRSSLSRTSAALLAGIGAGIGTGMFILYGVSNSDLLGSIITSIIVAVIVGISVIIPSRWWR